MKLVWQPQALQDLQSVRQYINADNPIAANRVVAELAALVNEQLLIFPESGREGRVAGTRELVVSKSPFIVPYRIKNDVIEVLGVHHASRRWPSNF